MVSIVVPVHNAEKYIRATIRSVCAQTYKDWELILVDDCSTDKSVEIIEEEIRQGKAIRLIKKEKNEGAAKARNTGVEAAKGRYIAFLDADDLWRPQKLEHELRFMEKHNAAFVFSAYQFGDEDGKPTGKAVRVPKTLTYKKALTRTVIFTSTVVLDLNVIPRELVRMPDIPSEDTATWWQILKTGVVAYGLDEPLAIYRRSEGTLSSNKGKAVKRIWNLYKEEGIGPVRAALNLLAWAWRASVRRVLDDAVRSHMEAFKRFTVLQLSLIGIILHTVLYGILWFRVYYPIISSPFYSRDGYYFGNGLKLYFRGHFLVLLIYFVLLVFLAKNNGAMRTGYHRPTRIFSAMVTALGITNLLTYFQLSLMRNWLLNAVPMLGLYAAQILLALGWTYLSDSIYRHVFPARETLVVYGNPRSAVAPYTRKDQDGRIREMLEKRSDRFQIMKEIDITEGLAKVEQECLSWYGCVVLYNVPDPERRELIEFCYSHYIRVYLVPDVADLLLQGMDQMDALGIPMLEMKEYAIDWEARVLKRAVDAVVSAVGIVLCSPFLIYGKNKYGMKKETCMTKDGRPFTRHTFECDGALRHMPLLLDVLRGDMSLIGPEPLLYQTAERVNEFNPHFFYRVRGVKAGMVGYTQLLGKRYGDEATVEDVIRDDDILKLDLVYIENFSIMQDFRLLLSVMSPYRKSNEPEESSIDDLKMVP